jgi:hypothetical protein
LWVFYTHEGLQLQLYSNIGTLAVPCTVQKGVVALQEQLSLGAAHGDTAAAVVDIAAAVRSTVGAAVRVLLRAVHLHLLYSPGDSSVRI